MPVLRKGADELRELGAAVSSVRMCDRQVAKDCWQIFSENADGWSVFQGTIMRRDPETGRVRQMVDSMDACPACTGPVSFPERPQLALQAPRASTPKRSAPRADPEHIAELEHELGIGE